MPMTRYYGRGEQRGRDMDMRMGIAVGGFVGLTVGGAAIGNDMLLSREETRLRSELDAAKTWLAGYAADPRNDGVTASDEAVVTSDSADHLQRELQSTATARWLPTGAAAIAATGLFGAAAYIKMPSGSRAALLAGGVGLAAGLAGVAILGMGGMTSAVTRHFT